MLSPSVTAFFCQNNSIESPLWNVRRRSSRNVSLGTAEGSRLAAHHPVLHVLVGDDGRAVSGIANLQ